MNVWIFVTSTSSTNSNMYVMIVDGRLKLPSSITEICPPLNIENLPYV